MIGLFLYVRLIRVPSLKNESVESSEKQQTLKHNKN